MTVLDGHRHVTITAVTSGKKIRRIIAVCLAVMLASIVGQGVILIEASVSRMSNQIGMLLTKVVGYSVSELPGCFGIAVVVILAPSLIDIVDFPGRAIIGNLPIFALHHALVPECQGGIRFFQICLSCCDDVFRLGKALSVCNDIFQSHNRLEYDSVPLGNHLFE